MHVRLACRDDLPAILDISNYYALNTPANFAIEPEKLEQWQASFDATHTVHPWLVATEGDRVLGFAKSSPWKGRCAYVFAAETTVYIAHGMHGRGVGKQLYGALIHMLERQGYRTLIGGITLPNPGSVALHESLGFRKAAEFKRNGWKFGAWHDVGYWQLMLGDSNAPPSAIKPVADVLPIEV